MLKTALDVTAIPDCDNENEQGMKILRESRQPASEVAPRCPFNA